MDGLLNEFKPENIYLASNDEEASDPFVLPDNTGDEPDPNYDSKYKSKKLKMRSEDYEINLGKVIDTLNSDYPLIFQKPLDYSIYIDQIEVSDPVGIAF